MNHTDSTAATLVVKARRLFARHGYDGASLRAITRAARANLGAVTYHFGSKAALYEAALASLADPFRQRVAAVAATPGPALDRIERVVAAFFAYLSEHPDMARLIAQQMASRTAVPAVVRRTLQANHGVIAALITEGQRDGSIRHGDARLMALSIGSQPVMLTLMRAVFREAIAIDQNDPATRSRLVKSVTQFVRAGLAAGKQRHVAERRGGGTGRERSTA